MRASGEFEVNLQPLVAFTQGSADARIDRFSITKTFRGDLNAHSLGEMISARSAVQGSAGYVAIEQVEGTLHGRQGTFVLQHYGVMAHGAQRLLLEVVPDSGSGELATLAGSIEIRIEGGRHFYDFEYSIAK